MLDIASLILRLGGGLTMLLAHGIPKIQKASIIAGQFPDPFGIGNPVSFWLVVFAEVIAAALLVLGALTRISCIPLIVTMLVAVFVIHAADPFQKQELGLMFLVVYSALLAIGPGKYSLDHLIIKKRRR